MLRSPGSLTSVVEELRALLTACTVLQRQASAQHWHSTTDRDAGAQAHHAHILLGGRVHWVGQRRPARPCKPQQAQGGTPQQAQGGTPGLCSRHISIRRLQPGAQQLCRAVHSSIMQEGRTQVLHVVKHQDRAQREPRAELGMQAQVAEGLVVCDACTASCSSGAGWQLMAPGSALSVHTCHLSQELHAHIALALCVCVFIVGVQHAHCCCRLRQAADDLLCVSV